MECLVSITDHFCLRAAEPGANRSAQRVEAFCLSEGFIGMPVDTFSVSCEITAV